MNAPKVRPRLGTPVTADMSVRDIAAALGVSKTELGRWCDLGRIPEDEFERRIAQEARPRWFHNCIRDLGRCPGAGRVTRALSMFRGMSVKERAAFLSGIAHPLMAAKEYRKGGIPYGFVAFPKDVLTIRGSSNSRRRARCCFSTWLRSTPARTTVGCAPASK
jgi:hypothetical protein